jgi:DNA topoisomerase-1
MEQLGIGRPSTFANTIETLKNRKYIETQKKAICVTELGIRVVDFLVASNFCFIDLQFTSNIEEKLDQIANKKLNKLDVLKEFWEQLKKDIENAKNVKASLNVTTFKCPKCGGFLVKKFSRFGAFYSCQNYSNKEDKCEYIATVGDNGEPVEKVKKILEESDKKCPNCGSKLIIRTSKKNTQYLGCKNFAKDEACKGFFDTNGKKIEFKKKKFNKFNKFKKFKKEIDE